jgi:pSer/pThr/pTyr-binding forkhead associated (FHA) protein
VLGGPDAAGLSGPVSRTAWVAVIAADREYFTAMMSRSGPEAEGLYFPAFSPEVRLPLTGNQITVGRRRHSTGEAPDIDLARAPEDPGVSHQHAVLVQQPDGSWAVVDQNSTNGTTVNLGEDPIRPYTPVPLDEGDRVHVGAWTTITLRRA